MTVVLRNVFHPDDFVAEPTLRQDLEADMLSECAKLGAVDKVRVKNSDRVLAGSGATQWNVGARVAWAHDTMRRAK